MKTLYRPELLYADGRFVAHAAVLVSERGEVVGVTSSADTSADEIVNLPGKALMPGFVNAHSHSFQRLIRGKSESRTVSGTDFWSWRGTMYHGAARLDPKDVYDVARMAFLEMVLAGTTTVGEFHYLHNAQDGRAYEDPNLLSKQVIAAAQSVGVRIVLLRTAYLRSGFEMADDKRQIRFFESTRQFLDNLDGLVGEYPADSAEVRFGVAPHSIRAVPLNELKEISAWSRSRQLPIHMHVAEQVAENAACEREYGMTPVELLNEEGLLGPDFTAVHAIHISVGEIDALAQSGARICCCPTTERNLGDGIFAADEGMKAGIQVALGSDSQAQIDPLEDARELDYHLRLSYQKRAVLDQIEGRALATRLFDCATVNGARALNIPGGTLRADSYADFFTVDLKDVSIAGHTAEDLLPMMVFSLGRSAIRDVVINGRFVVTEQRHALEEEIVARYKEVHQKVWYDNLAGSHRR